MIHLHFFRALKYNFVFDASSFKIFFLKRRIYSKTRCVAIHNARKLYIKKTNESTAYSFAPVATNKWEPTLSGVTVALTEMCNMNCTYCYVMQQGQDGNFKGSDFNTVMDAIKFAVYRSDPKRFFQVTFFGGEPLLRYDLIKSIVNESKIIRKDIAFSITTNGTILNEDILNLFKNEEISITVSIDGTKEIQDKYRVLREGGGTYHRVIENIKKINSECGEKLNINCVLYHGNTHPYLLYDEVKRMGLSRFSMTPISSIDKEMWITQEDADQIMLQSEKICKVFVADAIAGKRITIPDFWSYVSQLLPPYRRSLYCGMGTSTIAIDGEGKIYPCHRYIGTSADNNDIYHVKDFELLSWQNKIISSRNHVACKQCWMFCLCMGGCAHECEVYLNGSDGYYGYHQLCRIKSKWAELALASYALIRKYNPSSINVLTGLK